MEIDFVMYLSLIFTQFIIGTLGYNPEYSCENTICNPRSGDLLIGRESSLWASSTCGMTEMEPYCVVTTSGKSFCNECRSMQPYNSITNPKSHRIENVVSRVPKKFVRCIKFDTQDLQWKICGSSIWWQSENGINNVTIVLNLDTQFQFMSTLLIFKTYRPAAMYLERSYDFGRTWKRYAYFSNNCKRDFPSVPFGTRRSLTDVTCTGIYSQLTPSEGGVVAYMAAPSEMHAEWPQYSKERMNLTAITNLRARFTRLNTLGDMRVDGSLQTQRKYYYALYEWNVWGRCTCFGHAVRCKPKSSAEIINPEKVYGVCECTHNTAGENCETCADFYWDKPWRPATRESANACERCNCNNHATSCFFNPVLYLNSGNVSGGNCHNCMHNTEGVNCEFCRPNFYRLPGYPIDHPATCQPCDCHRDGTLYSGYCQQYTKAEDNSVAGRCLCKENVGGDKCDRCKVGFWNFQVDNVKGCQPCSCHMMGTLENGGCDPHTGLCTCKRYVEGPNCDRCLEGYFNLTQAPLGCQSCSCSQLGSVNPSCDRATGQCQCKSGFTGRDCGQVEDGYFVRPPHEIINRPGEKEIALDGLKGDGRYVIVLDVDPKQFGEGDQWTIYVKPYQYGATRCQNPPQTVNVYKDTNKIIISDVCLEAGLPIVLQIMPESQPGGPFTEILITDIVLVPVDDSALARRCEGFREVAMQILAGHQVDRRELPPECEAYFRLPRVSWRETGASTEPCLCNTTGSQTDICDKATGQCPCKPGVIGRRCDKCAPYHYDFSAVGCTDCSCNPQGAVSLQCNEDTSQCPCRPGIGGKHCDSCQPGTWDFPACRQCQCNGFSDFCNQTTGVCENCRDGTGGRNCDRCQEGYYGDPLRGTPCRPCACPGGGVNHATECRMGSMEEQVCTCKPGYTGPRCSQCAVNYYGNPTEPSGSCQPCQCSGNIAPHEPNSCDPVTGQCLKCLYNSEGYNCEVCQAGYWGDATRQMCQPCNCYPPGTIDQGQPPCNRVTGQCPCLPFVVGARCYECETGFFNLTSGKGCGPCDCDPSGSRDESCDVQTGQCQCNFDRSGRRCDKCSQGTFGDPKVGCQPCNCHRDGSIGDRCDPVTGQCQCHLGVGGRQCDRCDRGTEGTQLPNCQPCGECWTNWDKAIDKVVSELDRVKNQTGRQLRPDLNIVFNSLVHLLDQLEAVPWSRMSQERLNKLVEVVENSLQQTAILDSLEPVASSLAHVNDLLSQRLTQTTEWLKESDELRASLDALREQLQAKLDEARAIELANPHGAYAMVTSTIEMSDRVKGIQNALGFQKEGMQNQLKRGQAELHSFELRAEKLDDSWSKMNRKLDDFNDYIRQVNRRLCGDNGEEPVDPANPDLCPSTCGGVACGPVSIYDQEFDQLTNSPSSASNNQLMNVSSGLRFKRSAIGNWRLAKGKYRTGFLSACAAATSGDCSNSLGDHLARLMRDSLALQLGLANAVKGIYLAEASIAKVRSTQREAEQNMANSSQLVDSMTDRLQVAQNATLELIEDVEAFLNDQAELSKAKFDEAIQFIRNASLNVSLDQAYKLSQSLTERANALDQIAREILAETEADRQRTLELAQRANITRDAAKDFEAQISQLTEAKAIYDDLAKHFIVVNDGDPTIEDQLNKVEQSVGGLNVQVDDFTKKATGQADEAKMDLDAMAEFLAGAEAARKTTLDTLAELERSENTYKELEEKMGQLESLMKTLDQQQQKNGQPIGGSDPVSDPSKLVEQVKNYTLALENDTNELKEISADLKAMEEESERLTEEMDNYLVKIKQLSQHMTKQTKFHELSQ